MSLSLLSTGKTLSKSNIRTELDAILQYWETNMIDREHGGFIGEIDYSDRKNSLADKGAVLNARILWSFSAGYQVTKNPKHLELAERAYNYIKKYFFNAESGGIYWSLDYEGRPKDTKNQIYAVAFVIYGLTEFWKITENNDALQMAIGLYNKIEEHSYDKEKQGYFEAFGDNWQPIEDLRLSEKDANEKKTMNTHLHIVEAYANLYQIWPDPELKRKIGEILYVIDTHFIDKETGHLLLFFDENWIERPDVISYGHDIEAAWLLLSCAEAISDTTLIEKYRHTAIELARTTKEGIDSDGGLWYEFDPGKNSLITEKHSWPQAELWIGMINAWQLTQDIAYYEIAEKNFGFVEKYLIDKKNGEWKWGIYGDYSDMLKDKAGFWKCPYHNSRACMELLKRLQH